MHIILLTGIPGMGKTKIGNHLKDNYDFFHIDLEDPQINSSTEFIQFNQNTFDPDKLMGEIKKRGKSAIITWGFYPGVQDALLLRLKQLGAEMFWLDGDRFLAKESWKKRDNIIPDHLFDTQIDRIDNHDIQGIFSPINLNTFDDSTKKHRDIEKIIKDILQHLGNK